MTPQPMVVRLTGASGRGKTTLAEKLIDRLTADGLRVGAIKRSHHDVETDTPGKDSYRLRQAGAAVTALASDRLVTLFERPVEPPTVASLLAAFAGKTDIVVVESFNTGGPLPEGSVSLALEADGSVTGGDTPLHRDDVERIAALIQSRLKR